MSRTYDLVGQSSKAKFRNHMYRKKENTLKIGNQTVKP